MKRVVLTLAVALALLAVPAVAQTSYPNTNETQETPAQEQRTNPDVGSTAPGSGLTLSGTVVSWTDEQLVVKTATGVEHIALLPTTTRPSSFTAGEAVTIDYTRSSQNGVMVASQVRPGGTATGTSSLQTTTPSTTESALEQEVEETTADLSKGADQVGAELSKVDDAVEEEI